MLTDYAVRLTAQGQLLGQWERFRPTEFTIQAVKFLSQKGTLEINYHEKRDVDLYSGYTVSCRLPDFFIGSNYREYLVDALVDVVNQYFEEDNESFSST